jgi:hypothetical protein
LAQVAQNGSAPLRRKNSNATLREIPAVTLHATSRVDVAADPPCELLADPADSLASRNRPPSLSTVQVEWEPANARPWIRPASEIANIDWLSTQDALDFDAASAGERTGSRWFGHLSLGVALIAFTIVAVEVVARVRIDSSRAATRARRAQSVAMQVSADLPRAGTATMASDPALLAPAVRKPALAAQPMAAAPAEPSERAPAALPVPAHRAPTRPAASENPPASRPITAPRPPTPASAREAKPLDGMNIL